MISAKILCLHLVLNYGTVADMDHLHFMVMVLYMLVDVGGPGTLRHFIDGDGDVDSENTGIGGVLGLFLDVDQAGLGHLGQLFGDAPSCLFLEDFARV